MLLPFTDGLVEVSKFDVESVFLADKHYSRQKPGSNQFMPPGRTMVLRNSAGSIVFGWLWQEKRDDGQAGYNCSIFRNESDRLSSDVIIEAEAMVFKKWGLNRLFTYVDPSQLRQPDHHYRKPKTPGKCFVAAGYKLRVYKNGKPHTSQNGLWLFVKTFHI
jgi:hypothetical protein